MAATGRRGAKLSRREPARRACRSRNGRCRSASSRRASAPCSKASPRASTIRRSPRRSGCRKKRCATTSRACSTRFGVEHRYQAIVRAREAGLGDEQQADRRALSRDICPGSLPDKIGTVGAFASIHRLPQIGTSAREACVPHVRQQQRRCAMPKFVIEREIAGAGKLPKQELQAISQKSCGVLQEHGAADPVGAELRHRRQDLLRLHRAG